MTEKQVQQLRWKQFLYQNLLYLLYGFLFFFLIVTGASGPIVYGVLAIILLITPISVWLFKTPHLLLYQLPVLRKLKEYEKEKLQEVWWKYYSVSAFLQVLASLFFLIQMFVRDMDRPFAEGIPNWYFWVILLLFIPLVNWYDWLHVQKIDRKSSEELKAFTADRFLFTIIFSCVALGMTGIGILVIWVMRNISVS